jgi:hypothetical protein
MAYSPDLGFGSNDPEVDAAVRAAVNVLAAAGADVDEVSPGFSDPVHAFHVLWFSGEAKVLAGKLKGDRTRPVDPGLLRTAGIGARFTASDYLDATAVRMTLGELMGRFQQERRADRPADRRTPARGCPGAARRTDLPGRHRLAPPGAGIAHGGGAMSRLITVSLDTRGVTYTARLLDDAAPRTCAAVWDALPLSAQVFHGKYARNEIYTLLPAFGAGPGRENTTVTPIPGDLCWFSFDSDDLGNPAYGYENTTGTGITGAIVDLALFYGRNNLLINGDQGWVPGNVFGAITDGLEEMAAACQDLWMGGARGETLSFARAS